MRAPQARQGKARPVCGDGGSGSVGKLAGLRNTAGRLRSYLDHRVKSSLVRPTSEIDRDCVEIGGEGHKK